MRRLRTLALVLALCVALAACEDADSTLVAPGPFDQPSYLRPMGVALVAPDDGWMVGHTESYQTEVLHFANGTWALVPTLDLAGDLEKVTFVSANDGWAVEPFGVYHYDGSQWTRAWASGAFAWSRPSADISMVSATDGWAVGYWGILHYTGGRWVDATATVVSLRPPRDWPPNVPYPSLRAISMVSATDGWAAGLGGTFWHYDGTRWTPAPSPSITIPFATYQPEYSDISAVQMLSPTEGWAVGGPSNQRSDIDAVIEHFSGGRWTIVDTLTPVAHQPQTLLSTIAMASPTEGWAAGSRLRIYLRHGEGGSSQTYYTESFMLRYHDGEWTEVRVPNVCGITGIALTDPDTGWAVGWGGALRLHGGTWTVAFGQAPVNASNDCPSDPVLPRA